MKNGDGHGRPHFKYAYNMKFLAFINMRIVEFLVNFNIAYFRSIC